MATPPSNPIPDLFRRAMVAQNSGKADLARALYGRILDINARLPEVHYQLGRLEMGLNAPRQALGHLKKARELKPDEPVIWTTMLDAYLALDDAGGVAKVLQAARGAPLPAQAKRDLASKVAGRNKSGQARIGKVDPVAFRAATAAFEAGRLAEAEAAATALHDRHPLVAPVLAVLAASQAGLGKLDAAIGNYRKAIALDPSYAEAHLQLGQVLLTRNEDEAALEPLLRARELAPKSPYAARFLGLAYRRLEKHREALPLLEQARAELPDDAELLAALAVAALERSAPETARDAAARLVALQPDAPEGHLLLGEALAELDRNDAARAAYERALALSPDSVPVLTALAFLSQMMGDFDALRGYVKRVFDLGVADGALFRHYAIATRLAPGDPLVAKMERALADGQATEGTEAQLAFALAKVKEDAKDHAHVFPFLHRGNDALKAAYPIAGENFLSPSEFVRRACERGLPPPSAAPALRTPGLIFVTGMPRSGTTLVEQILASHSAVTAGGELGLMQKRLTERLELADAQDRALGAEEMDACGEAILEDYRKRFPGAPVVTDKEITTFQYIGLLPRLLPGARVVVVRRDPRDTCLSIYKNYFAPGTHRYSTDLTALAETYLRFLSILDYWRGHCPGAFHEIRYEDLIGEPETQARALIDACGLEWEDGCLEFHKNARKVRTLSVYQVRQPIYSSSVGAWKHYQAELRPLIEVLERGGALDGLT